ncbi:hypothetical protein DVH24_000264 [Malus domestica]|uniref:ABC transporter domain-containing protein n=1 Tax=Malus domestica TaxID=3750 RepID=A0A498J1V0_MALDO|nr:hypothetical protein DVH24_000264 [Malus domestica]
MLGFASAQFLSELARREKEAGIYPEPEIDLFMKATSMGGRESSLITDYTLKILGLDICKDTIVGDDMQRVARKTEKPQVTSRKDQEQYWADRTPYRYVSVKEFANRFKRFHVGMRIANELSVPFDKAQSHKAAFHMWVEKFHVVEILIADIKIFAGQIPDWWTWAYWIAPLSYGFNAISVNEMYAPRWMNKRALDNVTSVAPGKPQAIISEEAANKMELDQEESKEEPRLRRPPSKKVSLPQSLSSTDGNNTKVSSGVAPKRGMVLPFTPLAMSFDSVNYFVDMPSEMKEEGVTEDRLELLREVTGAFRPGILTALMGVSGAGKTTLMDVLAGRKTGGYIEGDIRISGYPKKQETFARISGYCEQADIHSPQVTIKESLIYSAFLRLPKEVNNKEKMIFVGQVMQLVELDNLKDALVALPGVSGLLTEQRKRLTIAVELDANPSIIFMDEPTSGLDGRAAAIVMRTVRNTVDTGRTVVCTIHQPSIDIFEAFDELLLMKREGQIIYLGGQVIYLGPLGRNYHKIVEYFVAVPGVPKIKEKYNPATWMLEASSTSIEVRLGMDFAQYYKSSG